MRNNIFKFKLKKIQDEQSTRNANADQKKLNGFKCFYKEFTDRVSPRSCFPWFSLPLPSVALLFLQFCKVVLLRFRSGDRCC